MMAVRKFTRDHGVFDVRLLIGFFVYTVLRPAELHDVGQVAYKMAFSDHVS